MCPDTPNPVRFRGRKTEFAVRHFLKAIRTNPTDAYAYHNLGLWWFWHHQYENALPFLDEAIDLAPNVACFHAGRASLFATATASQYRDGVRAVEESLHALRLAEEAGELQRDWRHQQYLDTLAAAYAESGDFSAAIRIQEQSCQLAITNTSQDITHRFLDLYREGKPARRNTIRCGASPPRNVRFPTR
jgi:tetratricopeptide (TPR) repeat protein